jgi:hypothetical protein
MSNEVSAIGVSMKSIAGSGKDGTEIVLQTHFPSDLTPDQMDWHLDKLAGRLDRQRTIGEIPALIESVEHCKKSIRNIEEDTERLDRSSQKDWEDSGRSGKVQFSKANQKQREEIALNLKGWKDRLAEAQNKLSIATGLLNEGKVEQVKAAQTA